MPREVDFAFIYGCFMWYYLVRVLLALLVLGVCYIGYFFVIGFLAEHHYAQLKDTNDLQDQIDKVATAHVSKKPKAKLVVGVFQKGKTYVKSYGELKPSAADTADGKLVYEIGSITKVFTGICLARMVKEEKAKLSDAIPGYMPDSVKLPEPLKKLTLLQLATHTSGLPRLPNNLFATVKKQDDPYVNYTAADLLKALESTKLEREPGKASVYSNLGMGLLGHLLAERAKKHYAELVQDTICKPLKMTDTTMTLSAEQNKRLLPGHEASGKPTGNWNFQVLAPTGGLRSTADDMLLFLEAHIKGVTEPLDGQLKLAEQVHHKGSPHNMGLAWHITEFSLGLTAHWHNGGTGGYSSFLAYNKEKQCGVVLLINISEAASGKLDQLGIECLKLASKVSMK